MSRLVVFLPIFASFASACFGQGNDTAALVPLKLAIPTGGRYKEPSPLQNTSPPDRFPLIPGSQLVKLESGPAAPLVGISISGGMDEGRAGVLSVATDGSKADIFRYDDRSGRQRWQIRRSPDGESYNILISGGVSNDRKYLSAAVDGSKVDLWSIDDGSGRQRWLVEDPPMSGPSTNGGMVRFRIKGGVTGDKKYLSTTSDGKLVDLWNVDDGTGRQRWFPGVILSEFNITVSAGVTNDKKYLSTTSDGVLVDLWNVDDGTGRQKWQIRPSPDGESFIIWAPFGVSDSNRRILSVTTDGSKVDLFDVDDGSGRQRWIVEDAPGEGLIRFRVAGGVSNDRKYLSATSDGRKIDLSSVDDGSGRQRWRKNPTVY